MTEKIAGDFTFTHVHTHDLPTGYRNVMHGIT
jgi:hypothetical protein